MEKEILLGGKTYYTADNREIAVRALPVRKFDAFAAALDDEPALVALFTNLEPAEVDALAVEDFEKILDLGLDINLAPFSRWLARRKQTAQMLGRIFDTAQAATHGGSGANT